MGKTSIAWTSETWNPTVGCTRVSAGCDHCYAFALHDMRHVAWKRGRMPTAPAQYHRPFSADWKDPQTGKPQGVQLLRDRLNDPLHWRKPRMVFVNSVSDLFHETVPGGFINEVWNVMRNAKQHTYQILTKRPERMLEWTRTAARAKGWPIEEIWPDWIWIGTSVENQATANERVPLLLQTPAAVRFLSCEPLLEMVDLTPWLGLGVAESECAWEPDNLVRVAAPGVQWVIVGGESGAHYRPMRVEWARWLREQCVAAGVAFFYKQGSGPRPGMHEELDGQMWRQYPKTTRTGEATA